MVTALTPDEIAEVGERLYNTKLKPLVERGNHGKFLVMDLETEDFEIDEADVVASDRLLARHPNGALYGVRIGYPAAYSIGGSFPIETK